MKDHVHWWVRNPVIPLIKTTGSLNASVSQWEKITRNQTVLGWLREGIRATPREEGELHLGDGSGVRNHFKSKEEEEWAWAEVQRLLSLAAVEEYNEEKHGQGYLLTSLLLAPKSGPKKFRLVLNSSPFNRQFPHIPFKLEGFKEFLYLLKKGYWFVKYDMKEAYHQMLLHPDSMRFFAFEMRGKIFVMRVLPFGWSLAPYIFNKTMRELIRFYRQNGVLAANFFDDVMLTQPETEPLSMQVNSFVRVWNRMLGVIEDEVKSDWVPKQRGSLLGLEVDTLVGKIFIPEDKLVKYKRSFTSLSRKESASAREIASALGKIISVSRAFTPARIYSRNLLACLLEIHDSANSWDSPLPLSAEARFELSWLAENLAKSNGRLAWKPLQVIVLETDASLVVDRWGASCQGAKAGDYFDKKLNLKGINRREMMAVFLSLVAFVERLRGRFIELRVDNQVVVSYFKNMRAKIGPLGDIFKMIFDFCLENEIEIVDIIWIPSKENVTADKITREVDTGDWTSSPSLVDRVVRKWGPIGHDRFASPSNAVVSPFSSWRMTPGSSGENAFTQVWKGVLNYIVVPFNLIAKVIAYLIEQEAVAVMLIPIWPAQVWWSAFESIKKAEFRVDPSDFLPGPSKRVEPRMGEWKLVMALLDASK